MRAVLLSHRTSFSRSLPLPPSLRLKGPTAGVGVLGFLVLVEQSVWIEKRRGVEGRLVNCNSARLEKFNEGREEKEGGIFHPLFPSIFSFDLHLK